MQYSILPTDASARVVPTIIMSSARKKIQAGESRNIVFPGGNQDFSTTGRQTVGRTNIPKGMIPLEVTISDHVLMIKAIQRCNRVIRIPGAVMNAPLLSFRIPLWDHRPSYANLVSSCSPFSIQVRTSCWLEITSSSLLLAL